jgi:hypothetical protein
MKGQHILIEYKDGSRQWIENACEKNVVKTNNFKRIVSFCNSNFKVCTKRWTTGKTQFQKIVISEV